MVILLSILINFASFGNTDCDQMDRIRVAYGNIGSEAELLSFIDIIEVTPCLNSEPYMASAIMQKAQFAFAPWTKYRYFIKGRNKLELYIEQNPSDIEARYIRFLVQSHAPFFLGYNKEIKEDVNLIKKNINNYNLPEFYKKQILEHIKIFYK
jgi:hypothetical protein